MVDILIARLTRPIAQIIGEFLPFATPFSWFYPQLDASLQARRARLTRQEYLDFIYELLNDARYVTEFTYDFELLRRALRDGSVARLDNLKPLLPVSELNYFRNIHADSVQWMLTNHIVLDKAAVVRRMRHSRSDAERVCLLPLVRGTIDIRELNSIATTRSALLWFFERPRLLYLPQHGTIDLDNLFFEDVFVWLDRAPVDRSRYTYTYLIDYAETAEQLEYFRRTLFYFTYSSRAIATAIELNQIKMLQWWEDCERKELLRMDIPKTVYVTKISPDVEAWARQHWIQLCEAP